MFFRVPKIFFFRRFTQKRGFLPQTGFLRHKFSTSHFMDGRIVIGGATDLLKNVAFYPKQDFSGTSFPHLTLWTVECSTSASIRGPRNRGKFGDRHIY